jgi:predicted SAM-dependent methyltransferase
MNEVKVNLGSGEDYKLGWVNVDIDKSIKADIYADFIKKIPFKNNSVDIIFCKNVFEHIPNPLNFLLEIKRVLKPGGRAIIITDNSSYFIFHWPRRKAHHDFYNETHEQFDNHYFFFQKGHLIAFTKRAGFKLKKLEYHITDQRKNRNHYFQVIIAKIIGKKFGYGGFLWEIEK